jgi:hypothetical protein
VDAVRALEHHLLHVGPEHLHRLVLGLQVDQVQELHHVPHQLLADPLARAVDAQLQARGGVEHGRREHGDGKGLAEPANKNKSKKLIQI